MMTNITLTQQMNRYTVIAALKAVFSDLEFACFLNVARSFVKVCKELEVTDGDTTAVAEHGSPAKNRQIILKKPNKNPRKSINAIAQGTEVLCQKYSTGGHLI